MKIAEIANPAYKKPYPAHDKPGKVHYFLLSYRNRSYLLSDAGECLRIYAIFILVSHNERIIVLKFDIGLFLKIIIAFPFDIESAILHFIIIKTVCFVIGTIGAITAAILVECYCKIVSLFFILGAPGAYQLFGQA